MKDTDQSIRDHLLYLLRGGGAHLSFENFIKHFKPDQCDRKIDKLPYTPWQVLEHMRLAQWDILDFCLNPDYAPMTFPDDYWPKESGSVELWQQTVTKFRNDLRQMEELVANPRTDLFAKIPHGDGQTILREALLVADHNDYHLGTLAVLTRLL